MDARRHMVRAQALVVAAMCGSALGQGIPARAPSLPHVTATGRLASRYSEAVAVVNGQSITRAQLAEALILSRGYRGLTVLVKRSLLEQAAAAAGISVTDEEIADGIEKRVEEIIQQQAKAAGQESRQAFLDKHGMTMEQARARVRACLSPDIHDETRSVLLAMKLIQSSVHVTDTEIAARFQQDYGHRDDVALEQVRERMRDAIRRDKEKAQLNQWYVDLLHRYDVRKSLRTRSQAKQPPEAYMIAAGQQPQSHDYSQTVARVGNREITRGDLAEALIRSSGKHALGVLVKRLVIHQEADELGVRVTTHEVRNAIMRRLGELRESGKGRRAPNDIGFETIAVLEARKVTQATRPPEIPKDEEAAWQKRYFDRLFREADVSAMDGAWASGDAWTMN